jgi:hypothetical protein
MNLFVNYVFNLKRQLSPATWLCCLFIFIFPVITFICFYLFVSSALALSVSTDIYPDSKGGSDDTGEALSELSADDGGAIPSTNVASDGWYSVDKGQTMHLASFDTSGIPAGVSVTSATLYLQYDAEAGYNGTSFVRYDNGSGMTNTTMQPWDFGEDLNYNLYAQGVDTVSELTALDIDFVTNDSGQADTLNFDYLYVTVEYNATGTELSTGSDDPDSFSITPGSGATTSNTFSFKTEAGSDTVTSVLVGHQNASSTSLIEITSIDGTTVYGSSTNPTGTSTSISLSQNTLTTTSGTSTYAIRITPKTNAQLPSGALGDLIEVRTSILEFTSTNVATGTDSAPTIYIDNQALPTFDTTDTLSFATKVDYSGDTDFRSLKVGDVDNDGDLDIVGTNSGATNVKVFINDGAGNYTSSSTYTTAGASHEVSLGDVDNDGYLDIVVPNLNSPYGINVFLNDGDGTFGARSDYTGGPVSQYSLAMADVNNDGFIDVLTTQSNGRLYTFINDGDGTFTVGDDYYYGTGETDSIERIETGDFNGDGFADVVGGSYSDDRLVIFLNNTDGTFATTTLYNSGDGAYDPAVGDIDKDGDEDIVITNRLDSNIVVFFNDGDATFDTSSTTYSTGAASDPYGVEVYDVDNDGWLDAVVATADANAVRILLNNGDGTLAAYTSYATANAPRNVVVGDLDGDGRGDLALNTFSNDVLSILINDTPMVTAIEGNGQVEITYTTPVYADLDSVIVLRATSSIIDSPTDGSSYSVSNIIGTSTVICVESSVATGTAKTCTDTSLTNGTDYYYKLFAKDSAGNYSYGIAPDGGYPATPTSTPTITLGTGASDPSQLRVAPGSGATTSNTFTFVTGSSTAVVTAVDLVLSNASSTSLIEITSLDEATVYGSTTNPTGTSTTISLSQNTLTANDSVTTYAVRITPKSRAQLGSDGLFGVLTRVSDFTTSALKAGSDTATVVIIDNEARLGFGAEAVAFEGEVAYALGQDPLGILAVDIDNDTDLDLVTADFTDNIISVSINDGDGTFDTSSSSYTTGTSPDSVAAGYFNNDTYLDLIVANSGSNNISVFINNTNGTFASKVDYVVGGETRGAATGDFDNDGFDDIAIANYDGGEVGIFINDGDGTFDNSTSTFTVGTNPIDVAVADVNGDGNLDLASANYGGGSASVLVNNGNGTFAPKTDYTAGSLSRGAVFGDINNDGLPDLAVTNYGADTVSVFTNNGDSTFNSAANYDPSVVDLNGIQISDIDSDGYYDLITASRSSANAAVLLNDGDGTFTVGGSYSVSGGNVYDIVTADLDGDGRSDLAAPGTITDNMTVRINNSTSTLSVVTPAQYEQVTINYTTPAFSDLDGVLVLRSTSAITDAPVDGTTYFVGNTIGASTVACVTSGVATSTAGSCVETGLTNGTPYYFKAFVKDLHGNYSVGLEPVGSPATPTSTPNTTLGTGAADPTTFKLAPGGTAIVNSFTFITASGSSAVTAVEVIHNNATSTSLVEIISLDGATVYGSTTNPTGSSTSISLSMNTLTATTGTSTYAIRVTAKDHADLPFNLQGSLIPFSARISDFTTTNIKAGSDTANGIIIDDQSFPYFGITDSASFANDFEYVGRADCGICSSSLEGITAADVDNDGDLDLLYVKKGDISEGDTLDEVTVMFNDGDGTFDTSSTTYTTGYGDETATEITVGHLNTDSYIDFVVSNDAGFSVHLNDGDGTFAARVNYAAGNENNISEVAIVDLNGDNINDIALTPYFETGCGGYQDCLHLIYNDGDGTFDTSSTTLRGVSRSEDVKAADVNNDGHTDLIMAGEYLVGVKLSNADGTFAATDLNVVTGVSGHRIALADFDQDGYVDIVSNDGGDSNVTILLNDGDGSYAAPVNYASLTNVYDVEVLDANNDGYPDVVVAYGSQHALHINNGDGTFAAYTTVDGTSNQNNAMAVGDLNKDGQMDFVVTGYDTVAVSLSNATTTLSATPDDESAIVSYTTPGADDLDSILVLSSTTPITHTPSDGTTYTVGNSIGSATVSCIDSTLTPTTSDSCTATGLTNGTPYYLKVFVKDSYGNYSYGVDPIGSPVTPTTTITVILAQHDSGQVNNAFNFQNKTDEEIYAFKMSPDGGDATIAEIVFTLSGIKKLESDTFANPKLYRDHDNDGVYDAGSDEQVGGAGVVSFSGQDGTITFSTSFQSTTSQNYIMVSDINAPPKGTFVTIDLTPAGVDVGGTGSVSSRQHYRNNRGGGGLGGSGGGIGDPPPAGGGELIGSDPNYKRPSSNSGSWTNAANAYDQTDGTYATDNAGATNNYGTLGYNIPGSNQIDGIEVKLEISGTTAAGDISVDLSWNNGSNWTSTKTTPTLTGTDTVVTLGGTSDTWGRAWATSETADGTFLVRVTGNPSSNTVQIDEIQVRIYHAASGGGSGGGSGGSGGGGI